jgi:beta-lactamase class A
LVKITRARVAGLLGRFKSQYGLTVAIGAVVASCVPQMETGAVEAAPRAAQARPTQLAAQQPQTREPIRRPLYGAPIQKTPVMQSNLPARAPNPYQQPAPQQANPWQPVASPQLVAAQRALDSRIRSLGENFSGDVGIAVRDIQTGWTSHFDGASHFPQQSVSKFWVSLAALDRADRGELNLSAPVTVRKSDLTLFNQPIASLIGADGYTTTLNSLIDRALTQSDNTANDFVLWRTGGPDAVRNFLLNKGINGVRFGPGERVMQARIAGMEWRPSMVGSGFYRARSSLPMETRRSALERYLADPIDGATPIGIVDALTRLHNGELLSPAATQRILHTMSNTRTGKQRLRGGLAPGWRLAHKTGTGQVLGATGTGYNDIGIVTGPDGRSYAVAVMIRRTSAPIPQRMQLMQNTVRAVIDYSRATQGYDLGARRPAYRTPAVSYSPPPEDYPADNGEEE